MTFTDLYLKFASEDEMRSVLFEKVPTKFEDAPEPDGERIAVEWEERQLFRNTDIVGLIVDTPAELNEEGEVISEATYVDGVHCNLRVLPGESELVEGLNDYLVEPTPATPARVWA
jgi:hypothetical protein